MKSTLFLINIAAQSAWAVPYLNEYHTRQGSIDGWAPAGPDDFRGPCPMMNTLANHGFLNHDGRNLTRDVVVNGLKDGINFDPALGEIMFEQALIANPEPNATFFTLDQLNVHNLLEHDGSLSRSDAYFGNNHIFNETVFAESMTFWNGDILDANALAMSKIGRQASSKAKNPTYRFTSTVENFSLGEISAPIIAFGDLATSTVNRSLVEYFFRNERLPAELGWTKKSEPVTLEAITAQTQAIAAAQALTTTDGNSTTTTPHRRRVGDLHSGMM